MGMREAVQEVIDDMEEYLKGLEDHNPWHDAFRISLKSYAKQLKMILKASDAPAIQPVELARFTGSPMAQHQHYIDKAREEFRKKRDPSDDSDEGAPMVEVVDGSGQQVCYVPFNRNAPQGAMTMIEGAVYKFNGVSLVYDEEETNKQRRS